MTENEEILILFLCPFDFKGLFFKFFKEFTINWLPKHEKKKKDVKYFTTKL